MANDEQKRLLDIFCEVKSLISGQSGVISCYIKHISVNKDSGDIDISAETTGVCNFNDVIECENALKQTYGFKDVRIYVAHITQVNIYEMFGNDFESFKHYIKSKSPSIVGFFNNISYELTENAINIEIPENGFGMVKENKYFLKLNDYVSNMTCEKYKITVKEKVLSEEEKELNRKARKAENELIDQSAMYTAPANQSNEETKKQTPLSTEQPASVKEQILHGEPVKIKKINYARKSIEKSRAARETESGETIIMGKDFIDRIIPLNDITDNSRKVSVAGKIFSTAFRLIKDDGLLVSFEITDDTNSITVKFFAGSIDEEYCKKHIKEGKWVKIYGEVQYDSFIREISIKAQYIVEYTPETSTDDAPETRVELHLHTKMSKMDAVCNVSDVIKQASMWGHKAVAITDHGVVQAFPEAYETVKNNKLDIKIIYGVECYLVDDESSEKSYHCIILVKNLIGLKNLYKLISESYLNYFHKRPRMPKELIKKHREGLIIGGACEAGEVYQAIMKNDPELEHVCEFYDYLEIQPLGNNKFMLRNEIVKNEQELKDINLKIIDIAQRMNKLCVATCDVHFMKPEDEVYRRILMAGQKYDDADLQAPLFFRNTEDMLKEFEYLGEDKAYELVVTNTNKIADMIENIQPIPDGTYPPKLENAKEELIELANEKAKEIYGDILPDLVKERMDKELNSIITHGFAVMYMIARKLVKKSNDDGYLVGSRGSVGSSLIANLAGITEVNSLPAHYICTSCKYTKFITDGSYNCGFDLPDEICPDCGRVLHKDGYDIPFETFLGFDGDKAPDIDLNFSGEYQARAHKYTEELLGEGYVYRAGTITTIADKTAFGFVKNYFENKSVNLRSAEINRLTKGCAGVRKSTGQHPGGIIVIPKDKEVYDFTPIQHPADDDSAEVITTHFEFKFLHDSLLKLDNLGHDDPTIIKMLEDITGISAKTIEIGEEKTMSLFNSTEALGIKPEDIDSETGTLAVPEFGTGFVRQMLVDIKPAKFSELISISGLSHGTDVWLGNAREIISQGKKLSDTIGCRDDIMLQLIHKGLPPKTAIKIMEAVRKGRGLTPDDKEIMKKNKVPDWYIESCIKIKYLFPKAHAAAYVMMAFRIAWYKVYHPVAFYTAYFTVRADEFDVETCAMGRDKLRHTMDLIKEKGNEASPKEESLMKILEVTNEMYARGFEFLPVDLYKSDSKRFIIEEGKIRPPFNSLQGLGTVAAEKIVIEREIAPFMSIEDLRSRAKVSKTIVELLKKIGCLDGLTETDQLTLF